jgi:hypothetical protein
VVIGTLGVWLGFPLADPIVGLLITIAIFGIVWQSARSVLTRMLDGVEPGVIEEVRHAAEHIPGVKIVDVKARWIGHQLHTDVAVTVSDELTVADANGIASTLRQELHAHLPALRTVTVTFEPSDGGIASVVSAQGHHHAPEPFKVVCDLATGTLEIVDTPRGERIRLTVDRHADDLTATVIIDRPGGPETLALQPIAGNHHRLESTAAPAEPHEFQARLILSANNRQRELPFNMVEPEGHHH